MCEKKAVPGFSMAKSDTTIQIHSTELLRPPSGSEKNYINTGNTLTMILPEAVACSPHWGQPASWLQPPLARHKTAFA